MKKLLMILTVITVLITVSACGVNSTTTVCTGTNEYEDKIVNTIISKEDVVQKQTTEYTSTYAVELEDGTLTVEAIKDEYNRRKGQYSGIKGLEYNYSFDEEKGEIIETITQDYTVADFEEFIKEGLLDDSDADYISLELSLEYYESEAVGFSCKANK